MKTIGEIRKAIESSKVRGAWANGVKVYALELIADMPENEEFFGSPADKKALLNGAENWDQYSNGGCALVYDGDIAERLCSPSELKKVRGGDRNPNSRESWIDVQTRALTQAASKIMRFAREA